MTAHARRPAWPRRRWLACVAALATGACSLTAAAGAHAADLRYAGCVGYLGGCAPTDPSKALDGPTGLAMAPDGRALYAVSQDGVISSFRLDDTGAMMFAGCAGPLRGCVPISPRGALAGAQAVAVSPDGRRVYVAASLIRGQLISGSLSYFSLNGAGDLRYRGCIGDRRGCRSASVGGALDYALELALTPDDQQLYVLADGAISHFALEPSGAPRFRGCLGDVAGCVPTVPAYTFDGASGLVLTPDGSQIYVANQAYGSIIRLTLGATGSPSVAGCLGGLPGCTATAPADALDGVCDIAIASDGGALYLSTSGGTAQLALDGPGLPVFAGEIQLGGCRQNPDYTIPQPPAQAVLASRLAVAPDGTRLYVAGVRDTLDPSITVLTLDPSGTPADAGCIDELRPYLAGCMASLPTDLLYGQESVAISPDGKQLYATGTGVEGGAIGHFIVGPPGS